MRVAAAEFAGGYEAASLNRIIRACGLSKSSFYHVISSKQELFDLVVADLVAAVARSVPIPSLEILRGDFWAGVGSLLDLLLQAAGGVPEFGALGALFYVSDAPPGRLTELDAAIDDWVGRALAIGRASGAVRTELPADLQYRLVLAVLRTFDQWSIEHLGDLGGPSTREAPRLLEAQLEALRRLLAP